MKISYHYDDFYLDPEAVLQGVTHMLRFCDELESCCQYLKNKVEKPVNDFVSENYENTRIVTDGVQRLVNTARDELSELIQSVIATTEHIVETNSNLHLRYLAQESHGNDIKYKFQ